MKTHLTRVQKNRLRELRSTLRSTEQQIENLQASSHHDRSPEDTVSRHNEIIRLQGIYHSVRSSISRIESQSPNSW